MKPHKRADGLLVKPVSEDTVVYDVSRFRAHCLEPLAARIWTLCDGERSVPDIAACVSEHGPTVAPEVVLLALRRLERAGLLESSQPRPASLPCSRRELIRRVAALGGLAVVSIALPTPAQAATLLPDGSPCGASAECASACCCGAVCSSVSACSDGGRSCV